MKLKCETTRRNLIAALGAAGAGMGLLPLLDPRVARAQGNAGAIPKRVIFVYAGDGFLVGDWEPRSATGKATPGENDWKFGPVLEPLNEYHDKIIAFQNLDMVIGHKDPTSPGNAHLDGATHAMTAAYRKDASTPGAASVDQVIARELNKNGPVTPLPSFEVGITAHDMEGNAIASAPGVMVPFLNKPPELWARLFSKPLNPGDETRAKEQQQRMLGYLKGEFDSLGPKVPARGRAKLADHLTAVDDLWKRLSIGNSNRALNRPPESLITPAKSLDWGYNAPRDTAWVKRYEVSAEINMKLVAAAMHTDSTRVATILMSSPPGGGFGYVKGVLGTSDEHDLTHKVHNSKDPLYTNTQARGLIFKETQAKADKIKILLDELTRLKEVDGSSLLDHTLVVVTGQIANGSHSTDQLPWFTIGSSQGYFKTGRYIEFPRAKDLEKIWLTHGRPHNDLFASVCNAMGMRVGKYGEPSVATGPINEMTG